MTLVFYFYFFLLKNFVLFCINNKKNAKAFESANFLYKKINITCCYHCMPLCKHDVMAQYRSNKHNNNPI